MLESPDLPPPFLGTGSQLKHHDQGPQSCSLRKAPALSGPLPYWIYRLVWPWYLTKVLPAAGEPSLVPRKDHPLPLGRLAWLRRSI
jgi:hypothetical protein